MLRREPCLITTTTYAAARTPPPLSLPAVALIHLTPLRASRSLALRWLALYLGISPSQCPVICAAARTPDGKAFAVRGAVGVVLLMCGRALMVYLTTNYDWWLFDVVIFCIK